MDGSYGMAQTSAIAGKGFFFMVTLALKKFDASNFL